MSNPANDLLFTVEGAEAITFAAVPTLAFRLRVAGTAPVHSAALRCQIRIEPTRRTYDKASHEGLFDLFGRPQEWGRTLRSMLWTHVNVTVPAFAGDTVVEMPVPCPFDFNVAGTKYFDALAGGEVPLLFLFSGTVFYADEDGALCVAQIPWEKESAYRLPVAVWRTMMDHYYPNSAWLCLRKDAFDRLARYKSRGAFPSWEEALDSLLPPETVPSAPVPP